MKLFKISLTVLVTIFLISCNNKQPSKTETKAGKIEVVTPADFKEKSENQIIIDVRTPGEFAQGHIKGARNINLFDKNFIEQFADLDKSTPLYIYCRSGSRTSKASKKLAEIGFENIYDLHGGIINWHKNNFPIIK
ncbi:rhodanese-like domain-containing protein [Lutibacter sp. A64]|uniref:rhodanese-like domain-containing protein n=1 Tax=Lutibacter sp. A64 TaxID=2918526 RepID=UPI001F05ABC7|nr:rhodanese-like domain-containing protein [Lutibacter sp. A64]UMB53451.1 rhodanese-like domain-containing protein [Lutibacter sp. A64]